MSEYFYSANTNAFYAAALKESYIKAGTWPKDALAVDNSVYEEFSANIAPTGKYRVAGSQGLPEWENIPAPTPEQLIAASEFKRSGLMTEATQAIGTLQDAIDFDMATDDEKRSLVNWRKYRILLSRVDCTNPTWPERP